MNSVDAKFYLRKRYLIAGLVCTGWGIMFTLRTNLSISLVEMTSSKWTTIGNESVEIAAAFNWSSTQKGLILSSFSWGYLTSPIGIMIGRNVGSVTMFGVGIVVTGLLTLFTPLLLKWNFFVYLVARTMEGAFEGFAIASTSEIFIYWAPPSERSRLTLSGIAGAAIGTNLSYLISGTIAYYLNWEAVFYITGAASIFWYILWLLLVRKTPAEDKLMSRQEREYLNQLNRPVTKEKIVYPWKQILTSKPVWAYLNDRFVESWSVSFILFCLPIYIKDVHDVDIQIIGFFSGIPHISALIGIICGAIFADYLRNRQIFSITNIHKLYLTFAQSSAAIFLIIIGWWKNFYATLIFLSIFRFCYIITEVTYQVLPVDLCPRYARLLSGLSTAFLSIGYTLNPIVMGFIVTNHSADEWSTYFFFISVFNLWGVIIFYKFGSGDLQPWAISKNTSENIDYLHKNKDQGK